MDGYGGYDVLTGGAGNDTFRFSSLSDIGYDRITDLAPGRPHRPVGLERHLHRRGALQRDERRPWAGSGARAHRHGQHHAGDRQQR
ncbi:hypothetical protein [Azospirillum brasilense]|uniref:hypothetical protein n=1 Tax=Azospirillum brasilense TaxID=192 RepID=UPI003CE481E5